MTILNLEIQIPAPIEVVFDLARSVDVHVESASASGERAVGGVTIGLLELGDEVTWEARHLGIRQRLTSRITTFDRPHHFRDSMVEGIFEHMHHDHHFVALPNGGTLMKDRFDYAMPWGVFGLLADRLLVRRHLRAFLERRNRYLQKKAVSTVADSITVGISTRSSDPV